MMLFQEQLTVSVLLKDALGEFNGWNLSNQTDSLLGAG